MFSFPGSGSRRGRGGAPFTFWIVALSGIVLGLTTACSRRESPVDQATREGMLLLNNGTEPAEMDPQLATGAPEAHVLEVLFEGLTRLEPRTLAVLPGVARTWEVSDDALVYTFHLREDARWSDGERVTADDFIAGIRRLLTRALGSDLVEGVYYLAGAEDFYHGRLADFSAVGCRALDAHTLEYRLRYPKPFFLQAVSQRSWYPIPRHVLARFDALEQRNAAWTRPGNLVGNGPYVLREWRPRQFLTCERSPTYWGQAQVKLEALRFFSIVDQTADEMAFRAGQLHKTHVLPSNRVEHWQREQPEVLRSVPRSGTYYYAFNVTRPPFDDVRVRRALALAIDREVLTGRVLRTGEKPAYHFIVDGLTGYESRARVPYDPAEARRLLAAAGFSEGHKFPNVALLYNQMERHKAIAEAVQEMWRTTLGVDIHLRSQEWGVYLQNMTAGEFEIVRAGLQIEPYDPWLFLKTFTTGFGFNRTGWSNSEYDRLVNALEASADPVERESLAQQAEALLLQEMPIIPLHFYLDNYLVEERVRAWDDGLWEVMPVREAWLAQ